MTVLNWVGMEICEYLKEYGGDPSLCKGAVELNTQFLFPAVEQGVLSPQRVCDEYFQVCNEPKIIELSEFDYVD